MSEANGAAPAQTPDEVTTLKEKNDRLYSEAVHLKKQLESYSKLGVVDDLQGKLSHYEQLRQETAKTPEEIARLVADKEKELRSRFDNKFTEYETKTKALETELQTLKVVNPSLLKAAAIFRDTELELIEMCIKRDLTLIDGVISVKDEDGKPKVSKEDPRKFMSVDEYLAGLAAKYPGAAKPQGIGTGKEAGETKGANESSSQGVPSGFETWGQSQQSEWFKANPKVLEAFMNNKL